MRQLNASGPVTQQQSCESCFLGCTRSYCHFQSSPLASFLRMHDSASPDITAQVKACWILHIQFSSFHCSRSSETLSPVRFFITLLTMEAIKHVMHVVMIKDAHG
ncbi:hypothetical protein EI94DRAFT_910625 [Lactarius quietus]|nr:hypothetical protein EI94DRAFT_910625 [Lactarius quietus]